MTAPERKQESKIFTYEGKVGAEDQPCTAHHLLRKFGRSEGVEGIGLIKYAILDDRIKVDDLDFDGNTLFHVACCTGNLEFIKWLCEKGSANHKIRNHGSTGLHLAVLAGHLDCVRWLTKKMCFDPNEETDTEQGPTQFNTNSLGLAVSIGHVEMVEYLSTLPGIVTKTQGAHSEGWSLTYLAAYNGHIPMLKWLLASGFCTLTDQSNYDDRHGEDAPQTCLHAAILGNEPATVLFLEELFREHWKKDVLSVHDKLMLKDKDYERASDPDSSLFDPEYCSMTYREAENEDAVRRGNYIMQRNDRLSGLMTPFLYACSLGRIEVVRAMDKDKASPDHMLETTYGENGRTVVEVAISSDNVDTVFYCLRNVVRKKTIFWAYLIGSFKVVTWFVRRGYIDPVGDFDAAGDNLVTLTTKGGTEWMYTSSAFKDLVAAIKTIENPWPSEFPLDKKNGSEGKRSLGDGDAEAEVPALKRQQR